MRPPSFRLGRPAAVRLLVVCLALLAVEAWYPFRTELPAWRPTAPDRSAGEVVFDGGAQILSGARGEAWVAGAAATNRMTIRLEARTDDPTQRGPARLLAVSEDHFRANLMVGQDGDDLVVRLRRPGSDPSGDPALRVAEVFARDQWRAISVTVEGVRMTVVVDGTVEIDEVLAPEPLAGWDPAQRVSLGDEIVGERSWRGRLRVAEVSGGGPAVDLLEPGRLDASGGWHWRSRVGALTGNGAEDPLLLSAVRMLVFVPVGAAARRLLRRPGRTAAFVTLSAILLTVGKAFVATRHPSLVDTALSTVGGLAGSALAARAGRTRRDGGDDDHRSDRRPAPQGSAPPPPELDRRPVSGPPPDGARAPQPGGAGASR
jgi:hypothetical protein